ncbi:MAG: glycine cleavage system protein GcvH [Planctomycetota bacterium]
MDTPTDRKYTETHEWIRVDNDVITIGLTEHAVDQLTDVTFVEMKPTGTSVDAGDSVGEVESVKTTSDVYSPAGGEIIEVNENLGDAPETLNTEPYTDGWLVKVRITDASGLDALMDAAAYEASL